MSRKRASLTALWLGSDASLRVDLAPGREAPLFATETVAGARPAALRARELLRAPRPAPRVLLVLESLWTQTVDLPAATVAGLAPAELERLLAYELEPSSGVPAADAALAALRLAAGPPDAARFTVCLLARAARDELAHEVRAARAKLVGIAHPAQAPADGTALVEVWEEATLCAARGASVLVAARAGQRSWARSVAGWLEGSGEARLAWRGRARPERLEEGHALPALDDRGADPRGDDPPAWLARRARAALAGEAGVPVLEAPAARRARLRPRAASLCACAAIAALGARDVLDERATTRLLEERARAVDDERARLATEESRRKDLERELASRARALDAAAAELARLESGWDAQRHRLPELLHALVTLRPAGVVLRAIAEAPQGGLELQGLGVDPGAVNAFGAELARALRPAGWDVRPTSSLLRRAPAGAPYCDFSIPLVAVDAPATGAPGAATLAAGAAR